jgi:diguanylate cyclase (GGDEF)-like protein
MTADRVEGGIPRRWAYAVSGLLLSAGAPTGLLLVRLVSGRAALGGLADEWDAEWTTYVYVAVSTAVVFAWFGEVLGRRADALARLALIDGLTGLLNRTAVCERMEAEVRRSQRHAQPIAVLALDLDGLKRINDAHGHEGGDAALRQVADALRSICRASDIVGRWGGDEFLVLAPGDSAADARRLAERIRERVARHDVPAPHTVSIGIAEWSDVDSSAQLVLRRADEALYEAKRLGRDRVVVAGP